ncbi:hypothetical protein QIA34_07895 (plasmid) [Borreliella yangtzensis]|uniref:HicB family RNase H-like nuclease/DNA-binding protein H-NS n=1 Tax=Borreliella yangtzensis TaxID=683292 RepID=A0ABR6PFZ1_9SPIR|nr:putative HicB family RNase H-like nuclease/DNA-binding protein H-NS [Borreliella yangtzensis]
MNKKVIMFVICSIFALVISCKNYAISKDSKDLKNLKENFEEKVKGFLEIKKEELTEGLKSLGSEVSVKVQEKLMQADEPQDQVEEQIVQDVNNKNQVVEELEKKLEDLKKKIDRAGDKTTLGEYYGYEKELKELEKELEDKLKDKKEDKEKLKKKLKELEESLRKKKEERKQKLKEAQKKFQEYKQQVGSASGQSYGDQAKNQGKVGQEAWREASKLGLLDKNSSTDNDGTSDITKKVIEDALQKIEEEIKEIDNNLKLK